MDGAVDGLLIDVARELRGSQRRMFLAKVCDVLCDGSVRKAEERFGWGRETVSKGMQERQANGSVENSPKPERRGRPRSEDKMPQLKIDIRTIVEPHTHSDPELKTSRKYTNYSAEEIRADLIGMGYAPDSLPSERTIRDILNRMNYRLKRIQKGKPLKKTEHTDAIFENVNAARKKYETDPETLEISVDTKTKVKLGEYALGGKNTDGQ